MSLEETRHLNDTYTKDAYYITNFAKKYQQSPDELYIEFYSKFILIDSMMSIQGEVLALKLSSAIDNHVSYVINAIKLN